MKTPSLTANTDTLSGISGADAALTRRMQQERHEVFEHGS